MHMDGTVGSSGDLKTLMEAESHVVDTGPR